MENNSYRHELKYLIGENSRDRMRERMRLTLRPDENASGGQYQIRSLYFDDLWNSAHYEKEDGILQRKKYRIRIYNISDSTIRLERKKKHGAYIFKESAPLTREQVERLLQGDYAFLLDSPFSLCREFYVECVCHGMRPRTIVDYEREAWVLDAGTVRVTFDTDVRAAVGGCDLFDPHLVSLSVLEPRKLILEVKYTEFFPDLLRKLLPPDAAELTAASKYDLCYKKTQYLHGVEYWDDVYRS